MTEINPTLASASKVPSPSSNPVIALSALYYETNKVLEITLKELMIIKDRRILVAVMFRAASREDALEKASQLARANLGVSIEIDDHQALHFNTVCSNPVGLIERMVRENKNTAILVHSVPNEQQFILIQALTADVDLEALAEFHFAS